MWQFTYNLCSTNTSNWTCVWCPTCINVWHWHNANTFNHFYFLKILLRISVSLLHSRQLLCSGLQVTLKVSITRKKGQFNTSCNAEVFIFKTRRFQDNTKNQFCSPSNRHPTCWGNIHTFQCHQCWMAFSQLSYLRQETSQDGNRVRHHR